MRGHQLKNLHRPQTGVTLIEVLVSIVILSFGMLALGGMLAYAVQLPKLSGYRAAAASIAAGHIERMRANPTGFANGNYNVTLSYGNALTSSACSYPACSSTNIANADTYDTNVLLRSELPNGGMRVTRASVSGVFSNTAGDLWVIWDEPAGLATLDSATSDNCPSQVVATPKPRCLYVRFEL
jgi:type IV pilus assembly protein PilV